MKTGRIVWPTVCLFGVLVVGMIQAKPTPPPPPPKPPVNCKFVLCAYPDCLPGEHTETPAGQCCPVCVPD